MKEIVGSQLSTMGHSWHGNHRPWFIIPLFMCIFSSGAKYLPSFFFSGGFLLSSCILGCVFPSVILWSDFAEVLAQGPYPQPIPMASGRVRATRLAIPGNKLPTNIM